MTTALAELPKTEKEESLANSTQRIQIPVNASAWDHLDHLTPQDRDLLLWFHQHALNEGLNWERIQAATGYQRTTMFRILKGSYETPSWAEPLQAIRQYRDRWITRSKRIDSTDFAENAITERVCSLLDYSLASGTIGLLVGESRMGKTKTAKEWIRRVGAGRAVYVEVPPIGGYRALLDEIAVGCGIKWRGRTGPELLRSIRKALAYGRILIIDEAGRALPDKTAAKAPALEVIRSIHDQTGVSIALLMTEREASDLTELRYQFEQVVGRVDLVARLNEFTRADIQPIISQFGQFSDKIIDQLFEISKQPGRLGTVVAVLKAANRIAVATGAKIKDAHVLQALKHRNKLTTSDLKRKR